MKRRHKMRITITTDKPIGVSDLIAMLNGTFKGNEEFVSDMRDVPSSKEVSLIKFGAFSRVGRVR